MLGWAAGDWGMDGAEGGTFARTYSGFYDTGTCDAGGWACEGLTYRRVRLGWAAEGGVNR